MVMRARKRFVVIAYDITKTKKRNKVVKQILKYGGRVNLSVFECLLTDSQLSKLKDEIAKLIDSKTDQIAYYTLCVDCFTKIVYQPVRKRVKEISPTDVF